VAWARMPDATIGEEGVILIFRAALSALSAVSQLPPRRRGYFFREKTFDSSVSGAVIVAKE